MQALGDSCPTARVVKPSAQEVHITVDATPEKVLRGHGAHGARPVELNVPAPQGAAQSETLRAGTLRAKVPTGQRAQERAPKRA